MSPPSTPVRPVSSLGPTPFWRRLGWRLWSQQYLSNTRESWRLCWAARRGDGSRGLALVLDIFLGGVSLNTAEEVKPGDVLDLELWNRPAEMPAVWQVRVLTAERLPDGRWLLAGAFADRSDLPLIDAA